MSYYPLFPFISFLVNSLFGIYLSYKRTRGKAIFIYIYVIWMSALWSFLHFLIFTSSNPQIALTLNRISVVTAALTATFFLHFILTYTQYNINYTKKILLIAFFLTIIILILSLTTNLISNGIIKTYWGTWVTRGPAYKFFAIYIMACCITGILFLFFSKGSVEKKHKLIIFLGFSFPIIGGFITEFIPPLLGAYEIMPLSPELFTFTAGIILYGILRQDLLQDTPVMAAETIIQIIPDDIIIVKKDGDFSFMNKMAQNDFCYLKSNISLEKIFIDPGKLAQMLHQIDLNGRVENYEAEILIGDCKRAFVSINGAMVNDFHNNSFGYVFTIRNITDRKQAEEQIKYFAYHDPLTGLENRKSFYEYIEKVIEIDQRPTGAKVTTLLYIDLDNFKLVNDFAGHNSGDIYLKEIAKRIQNNLRKSDSVYRIGGDEFAVILHSINNEIDAGLVAQKLLESLSLPLIIKEQKFYPSASIGISIFPQDGMDITTLIKNADEAMYEAKKEKCGYSFYNPEMSIQSIKRVEILKGIRNALAYDQFINYYQPIMTIDGQILGVEALVRWQPPQGGLVMPGEFISIAENSRLIKDVDEWVLRNACREIQSLTLTNPKIKLFVNFSPLHINEKNVVVNIRQILQEYDFTPERLVIEVTEDFILDNSEYIRESLDSLTNLGIRMAIDDFGIKYSTIMSILTYPFSYLKIDRSFLQDIEQNQRIIPVIEGIVKTAEKIGVNVIAEGVENNRQLEILTESGCKIMQGYLYSKPVPYTKLKELLKDT